MRNLLSSTIWAKGALDHEPRKYRPQRRVWLPMFNAIAVAAGLIAAIHGSRLLDRIYGDWTDVFGLMFALVGVLSFIGLAWKIWALEMSALCVLVGMVFAYIVGILGSPSPEQMVAKEAPSYFIAVMLLFGFPFALDQINILADELFDRRVARRKAELLAEG